MDGLNHNAEIVTKHLPLRGIQSVHELGIEAAFATTETARKGLLFELCEYLSNHQERKGRNGCDLINVFSLREYLLYLFVSSGPLRRVLEHFSGHILLASMIR